MKIFETIAVIYIIYALAVLLHELAHFICAKFIHIKIYGVRIGDRFLAMKIKKFSISPLITGGEIEFDQNDLLHQSKMRIVLMFLSGSIANLFFMIIGFCLLSVFNYAVYVIVINAFSIVFNLFPIKFLGNDFAKMYDSLKDKKVSIGMNRR